MWSYRIHEIIATAFLAATNYSGHLEYARKPMLDYGLVPDMIRERRFNRRLHRRFPLPEDLLLKMGAQLKAIAGASKYVLDAFPVPVCDNIRISRCRPLKGKHYRGKW